MALGSSLVPDLTVVSQVVTQAPHICQFVTALEPPILPLSTEHEHSAALSLSSLHHILSLFYLSIASS